MALIFSLILLRINKCIKNANENNQIFRKRLIRYKFLVNLSKITNIK